MSQSVSIAPATHAHTRRWLIGLGAILVLAAVLLLVLGVNMRRGLNHDEHQFVASGALIAGDGLLPYRDFPYFHVPALSFIYALLFRTTDYLLLAARGFSVLSSWLMLGLLMGVALVWPRQLSLGMRLATGSAIVLALISTPSFIFTSGRAWNHDFPVLLTLAAACLQGYWLKRGGSPFWLLLSGCLIGLAAASRSSFALAAVPFVLAVFFVHSWRTRRAWAAIGLFVGGAVIGFLPALYAFALAPEQFIFGNLTYAQLNTQYYAQVDPVNVALAQKLARTVAQFATQPGNLLLTLLVALELWRVRASLRVRTAPELIFLLSVLPFLLLGAWAPTPIQPQYLYPLFPLLALIFLAALAYDARPRVAVWAAAGVAVISLILALPRYVEGAAIVFDPAEWYPLKVHARGELLADLAAGQRVLTLAPIFALEGKAQIYPEFVTGPLGWRVAPLLSLADRQRVGLVSLAELDADLAAQAPRGIFTGVHDDDASAEQPLLDFAQAKHYVPVTLPEQGVLWTRPVAVWGEQIQLGASDLPAAPVAPGSEVVATFYLQALQPPGKDLNLLLRVVAPDGRELVRQEGWPWGRPTSTWQPGDVWPDGHTLTIPAAAAPGPYRVELSFYDPATLALVGDAAPAGFMVVGANPPEPAAKPLAQLGDCIALLQTAVPPAPWRPGATQKIALTWQRTSPLCGRYTVFAHLVGPNGLVAQRDQEPLQGFYPTDGWLVDTAVTDTYELALPADLAAGDYQLLIGMYDPVTGQRLPVVVAGEAGSDAYSAATVHVE